MTSNETVTDETNTQVDTSEIRRALGATSILAEVTSVPFVKVRASDFKALHYGAKKHIQTDSLPGVRVKLIQWGKTSYGTPEAITVVGTYRLNNAWNGGWSVTRNNTGIARPDGLTNFATEAEAKAAAEADYRQRILSCIDLSPQGEPVAWLRDLDGTGSLHPASAGDPGAFPVYAQPAAISEEMVERACLSFIPHWYECTPEVKSDCFKDMRAALTAALSREA